MFRSESIPILGRKRLSGRWIRKKQLLVLVLGFACSAPPSEDQAHTSLPSAKTSSPDIRACMDNILYYDLNIDLHEYDSIGTYYFHEIKDYREEEAVLLFDQS